MALELKDHITNQADMLFSQYGIKSVTMDDIAKHLGMSKKTIYLHYTDKNALVVQLVRDKLANQCCVMDHCIDNSKDAVHEVFFGVTQTQEWLSKLNPMLFYDLQKYHPVAWQHYLTFREKKLFNVIHNNLKRGITEGNYRQEINAEILTWMRIEQIDSVISRNTYPVNQFNIGFLMAEITEHYLYGICTPEGRKLVDKYRQNTQEE